MRGTNITSFRAELSGVVAALQETTTIHPILRQPGSYNKIDNTTNKTTSSDVERLLSSTQMQGNLT